ncbi:MAG: hypothetical protein WBQ79_04140 [Acidobacteriaceae bacterium]
MFRIDDVKKLEMPMHCRSQPAGKSQHLVVINGRACHANQAIDLWGRIGKPNRMGADRKHRTPSSPQHMFSG